MDTENLKQYENRKVRLILNNGYTFVVDIIEVSPTSLKGLDKNKDEMYFSPDIISAVIPLNWGKNQ